MREYEGLVQVYTADDPAMAHLVAGALEAEGIATSIHNEALFSALAGAGLDMNALPSVWVAEKDAARAVAFVEEHAAHLAAQDDDASDEEE